MLLLGTTTAGALGIATGNIYYSRFICLTTGAVKVIKVYCLAYTDARVAIYTDVGGHPSALMVEGGPTTLNSGDWRSVSVAETLVTKDVYYWLAVQVNVTNGGAYRALALSQMEYQAQVFGAFPATATPTELDNYEISLQGHGSILLVLTETVTAADSRVEKVTKPLLETVTPTASLIRAITKILPETLTAADVLQKIRCLTLSEILTVTDQLDKQIRFHKVLEETITCTATLEVTRLIANTRAALRTREQASTREQPSTRENPL